MKNKLKIGRAIKDYTQQDLADKVGVSRQTINSIEKRHFTPSTVLALKISEVLDMPFQELFTLEESDWK